MCPVPLEATVISALVPGKLAATPTVFARRFIPNWLVPIVGEACAAMAGIVFEPDVIVGPLTVITYPLMALVLAAICEVAVEVAVGENN